MSYIFCRPAFALIALRAVVCADHALSPVVIVPASQHVNRPAIVFFQTGRHAFAASAQRGLDETDAVAHAGWCPEIQVWGQTDSIGSAAYH